jgi:hypothetical protein
VFGKRSILVFTGLIALGGALWLVASGPEFDGRLLRRLADTFSNQVRPILKGQLEIHLPPDESVDAELAYLQSVQTVLADPLPDCQRAAAKLRSLRRDSTPGLDRSIFRSAVQRLARGESADFVQGLAEQVRDGPGFTLRPTRPTEPLDHDARLRLLQVKTDRIALVRRAESLLRELADAGEAFSRSCVEQTPEVFSVLGYLLDPILTAE